MINALNQHPDNYTFAATQGKTAYNNKLAGIPVFNANEQNIANNIRLLLITAQNIVQQAEEQQLTEPLIIFKIKQGLLQHNVDISLANAVAIVYGAYYLLDNNENTPNEHQLNQVATWIHQTIATINYQANQVSTIKFLQEYLKTNNVEQANAAAEQIRQDVFAGKSIDGQLKYNDSTANTAWQAFIMAQDCGASHYFSAIDGGFKIVKNEDYNFYAATLLSIQQAFKYNPNHVVHQLTVDDFATMIIKLLPMSKGIIVAQFNAIIHGQADISSVPAVFAKELSVLSDSLGKREQLSATSKLVLDQKITDYLTSISARYIDFASKKAKLGCDIELKIIANYFQLQIKQHTHIIDDYSVINPEATTIVHIFYAPYQHSYHTLTPELDLNAHARPLVLDDYISRAILTTGNSANLKALAPIAAWYVMRNPIVWQANNPMDHEQLTQTINLAVIKTKEQHVKKLNQHIEKTLKKHNQPKTNATNKSPQYNISLTPILNEQLKLIAAEETLSIASIRAHIPEASKEIKNQYAIAKLNLSKVKTSVSHNIYTRELLAYHRELFFQELKALGVANIEAYNEWWQAIIKQQREAVESAFETTNQQINHYKEELTKSYEQQLTKIDNHYNGLRNQAIQTHQEIEEQKRRAKKKKRRRIARSIVGMGIAVFVAPVLAQHAFTAAGVSSTTAAGGMTFGFTVTTGAIAGGISSAISGGNIAEGVFMGGMFAGFGHAVDGILGEFIKNNELLRESLSIAATASLSTAINGGKLLDNILISIGANIAANYIMPLPKISNNQTLTNQQIREIFYRRALHTFTRSIVVSLVSKDFNLGTSLLTAASNGLQTWLGSKGNMLAQQQRIAAVPKQLTTTPTVTNKPRYKVTLNSPNIRTRYLPGGKSPPFAFIRNFTSNLSLNTVRIPGFMENFLQPMTPKITVVPSGRAAIMLPQPKITCYAIASPLLDSPKFEFNFVTRACGLLQMAGGVTQINAGIIFGTVTAPTGVGPILGAGYAAIGADNVFTGAKTFLTGTPHETLLNQSAHFLGLGDTGATLLELGLNLGPAAIPNMVGGGSRVVNNGMLKLFDLRRSVSFNPINRLLSKPKYVSTDGFRNELPLTLAQKQDALNYAISLGMPETSIVFVENGNTGYKLFFGQIERLQIGTDVLPSVSKSLSANSRVSMKGAIAHEIVGHRAAELASMTNSNFILEEAQASIRAARFADGLIDVERFILLRDAVERLRKAGYRVADIRNSLWIQEAAQRLAPR